jgi:hypothetical protein
MGRLPQKPRRTRVKSTTKLPACHSDGRTNNKIVIVRGALDSSKPTFARLAKLGVSETRDAPVSIMKIPEIPLISTFALITSLPWVKKRSLPLA